MAKKTDKVIEPIDADFDKVVKKMVKTAAHKLFKNNHLAEKSAPQIAASKQMPLDLGIEVQKDVNGIEMGVLENGIPYLTQRGLSRITGITRAVIQQITKEWEEHYADEILGKDRISFLKEYLFSKGFNESKLHIETVQNGSVHYAYPDVVCMAFLEYYAFESKQGEAATALENYRRFAAYGLRKFIYEALDYTPSDSWKFFHDRVSLLKDAVPTGYFSVFHEIPGMVVDLITAGLTVNEKTVPDISVGQHWARHWKADDLANDFGDRVPYAHNYPSYYSQATSNPQDANAYPDAALPEFRRWFKTEYLLTKFPTYLLTKASVLPGGKAEAIKIASMYQSKQLAGPKKKPS